jgi:ADP-ribose pyrophosphatase YjhB (NUDIX family)
MKTTKRYSGVIIKHLDKVLLCKRNNEGSHPGAWSIPAGKLEKKENPKVGAIREFFEETNIKLGNNISLCGFVSRKTRDNLKEKGLMYVFLDNSEEQKIPDLEKAIDGTEHTECGYFSLKNLPFDDPNEQLSVLIRNILSKT